MSRETGRKLREERRSNDRAGLGLVVYCALCVGVLVLALALIR